MIVVIVEIVFDFRQEITLLIDNIFFDIFLDFDKARHIYKHTSWLFYVSSQVSYGISNKKA